MAKNQQKGAQAQLDDHARKLGAKQLTPEEEAEIDALAAGEEVEPADESDEEAAAAADADVISDQPPKWAQVPDDLKMPPPGKAVIYVRIKAELTDYPDKGDRQCIMWNLTYADEKLAHKRCHGDPLRSLPEMVRAMVRSHDGVKTNWGNPRVFDQWWDEIGGRARQLLQGIYLKRQGLTDVQRVDFFGNCVVETSSR